MLKICEFSAPAGSGATEPFICRLSDDDFYYVKGRKLRCQGLVNEFICATLGQRLGLQIPDFAIALLPPFPEDAAHLGLPVSLGFGPVFASKRVLNICELDRTTAGHVSEATRRDIAAFDYWIGNADRTLTETGGNPNLFWNLETDDVVVLDHNLAFDPEFSMQDLRDLHVFRQDLVAVLGDPVLRRVYASRFAEALLGWDAIVESIPEEWNFLDKEMTVDAGIDFDGMKMWLDRLSRTEGWD